MKYNIGDFVIFLHGFTTGNIATVGTITATRKLENLPDAIVYTVHHPLVDMSYEYSEDHLKSTSISGKEYIERYGNRLITERRGANGK